jgi:Ribonuclease G/E
VGRNPRAHAGSAAPALIYGDSDLIKRAIRDIYNRDIEEVIIEGEEGYRHARTFMKLLMPATSEVRNYAIRCRCSSASESRTSSPACTSRSCS